MAAPQQTPAQPMRAVVKQAISGGAVVLRGRAVGGQPGKERLLYLAHLQVPRMGNIRDDRADEKYAYEARECLRLLAVGKDVQFQVLFSAGATEFGEIYIVDAQTNATTDVAAELLKSGFVKLKEARQGKEDAEVENRRTFLKDSEEEARKSGRGLWSSDGNPVQTTNTPPTDPQAFLDQYKNKKIDAIVEQVTNGSMVRVRLMLTPAEHQILLVSMAGVRAPRAPAQTSNTANGEETSQNSNQNAEPLGAEARYFAEYRLLQRNVTIELLSLPPLTGATNNVPFVGIVTHPAGSIAALLLQHGLARCVDMHAGILGASRMLELRSKESDAKNARRGVWSTLPITASSSTNGSANGVKSKGQEAVVTRVWGADSISIRGGRNGEGEERRIQLASVRQPRHEESKRDLSAVGLQAEGREYLRKRLIGKTVFVTTDYQKPADGQYEAKECCTVKAVNGRNVAEELVERGLLGVIKHRRDDNDKSSEIDKLIQAELRAQSENKGFHSGKDFPAPKISDASENATKANSFLSGFKRAGRIPVIIDFISSASRFKVFLPKQNVKLTLVLAGIRAPRTARNAGEKSEAFGLEAQDFVFRRANQRDAEIEIDATDKAGGFIGALYLNKTENLAIVLAKEGFATVSEYGLDRLPWARELQQAEEEAKSSRRHIWTEYDAESAAAAAEAPAVAPSAKKYFDVVVSDMRQTPFTFSVQILKDGSIPELESLMRDFSLHHKAPPSASSANFIPRNGDLVSAQYSVDSQWYRARVLSSSVGKRQATVVFIDYGNQEIVGFEKLRPLDVQFRKLDAQAKPATLSLIKLPEQDSEYAADAFDYFRSLTEGRPLVANIDFTESGPHGLSHLTLYDPNDPAARDENASINAALLREGLAAVDRKSRLAGAYSAMAKTLEKASEEAHLKRKGIFEFGDVTED